MKYLFDIRLKSKRLNQLKKHEFSSIFFYILLGSSIFYSFYAHSNQTNQHGEEQEPSSTLNEPRISANTKTVSQNNIQTTEQKLVEIKKTNILTISDEIKDAIDRHLDGVRGYQRRAEKLHDLLFSPYYFDITYSPQKTKTAQEVFDTRTGNCVGLASLFVAAARHAGLNAYFQSVDVPREWEPQDAGFYIVPGHLNVGIYDKRFTPKAARRSPWVMNNTFGTSTDNSTGSTSVIFSSRAKAKPRYIVEFISLYRGIDNRDLKYKVISDDEAQAEYFNNIGVEALINDDIEYASKLFLHSLDIQPDISFTWSNLGFSLKKLQQFERAEQAYKKALKIDKKNISTVKNLYVLYKDTNQVDKANTIKQKVDAYNRTNPHYQAKRARFAAENNDLPLALSHWQQAVKLKPKDDEFHFELAKIYFELGNHKKTQKHLKRARRYSQDSTRYEGKLDALASLMK